MKGKGFGNNYSEKKKEIEKIKEGLLPHAVEKIVMKS